MYRIVFGIVHDEDLAKDVTQIGLKSWENLRAFNPEYKFYSWLYRIMINEAMNLNRRKKSILPYQSTDRMTTPRTRSLPKRKRIIRC